MCTVFAKTNALIFIVQTGPVHRKTFTFCHILPCVQLRFHTVMFFKIAQSFPEIKRIRLKAQRLFQLYSLTAQFRSQPYRVVSVKGSPVNKNLVIAIFEDTVRKIMFVQIICNVRIIPDIIFHFLYILIINFHRLPVGQHPSYPLYLFHIFLNALKRIELMIFPPALRIIPFYHICKIQNCG